VRFSERFSNEGVTLKGLKATAIVAVLVLFLGCGDDGTTWPDGGDPPEPGYIWEVWEFWYSDVDWEPPNIWVYKYNSADGTVLDSERALFVGYGYDAAYGNGRLWVAAEILGQDASGNREYGPVIWEVGNDYFESPYIDGLTWDGKQLWGCTSYGEFYTINPETHESELMFTYEKGILSFEGLAWDGEYLWAVTPTTNEIIQIDTENGTKVHSVLCPGKYPNGLTWDGEALLVSDRGINGSVYRISPNDGQVLWVLYTGEKLYRYINGGLAFKPAE
jgi:hypothetical protein